MAIRRFRVAACTLTVAVLALAGCGGGDDGSGGVDLSGTKFTDMTAQDEVVVDAVDNSFKPRYIEITAGTTVTFRNDGRNPHNVLAVEKGAFEDIDTEDFKPKVEAEITFDEPGDVPYYCSLHGSKTKGMTGAVRVVEE
jgi:plastocyanin